MYDIQDLLNEIIDCDIFDNVENFEEFKKEVDSLDILYKDGDLEELWEEYQNYIEE